jgi:predicted O-methyltransferase YrrM
MNLEVEYERLCSTPSDIYEHLPTFVQLVLDRDAKVVLELGTRTGVSTIAWLYALQGRGHLTSVDIDAKPAIGDYEHWTFIQGDDLSPSVVQRVPDADIIFIDTSHHYTQTARELNLYKWLVKPGGVIVCHDTELAWPEGAPRQDGPYPVKRAIEEFVAAEGREWFNYPNCWGLGVIQM